MKLDYCAIGMRIKERRTKKEWSQEMLASTVGNSNPHMVHLTVFWECRMSGKKLQCTVSGRLRR